jgi:hypothetical protein
MKQANNFLSDSQIGKVNSGPVEKSADLRQDMSKGSILRRILGASRPGSRFDSDRIVIPRTRKSTFVGTP